jgi:hypothetical protein
MLASAIPDWADRHPGLTLLVVPDAVGPVVALRNAQGGLALPPIQRQGLLHRVLPSLPADLPARHDQLATGLATRLDVVRPERVDGSVLASLLHPADPVWPARLACWSGRERRIVELPSADWTDRQRWLERVGASMMRC